MYRLLTCAASPPTDQTPQKYFMSKWVEAASFADSLEESSYEL